MKKTIIAALIAALIAGSCTREKKSPIEGAWKCVYDKWNWPKTIINKSFPEDMSGGQIKIWSNGYYVYVGHAEFDTIVLENYGAGTYKLEGNRFEEQRINYANKSGIGQTSRLLIKISNDTLIQKWPADINWELSKNYSIEKYVRVK